jgi:hypothetical protein
MLTTAVKRVRLRSVKLHEYEPGNDTKNDTDDREDNHKAPRYMSAMTDNEIRG